MIGCPWVIMNLLSVVGESGGRLRDTDLEEAEDFDQRRAEPLQAVPDGMRGCLDIDAHGLRTRSGVLTHCCGAGMGPCG